MESKERDLVAKLVSNALNHVVYPKISKINHGYPTNIALVPVQGGSNEMMVVATDDIPVGAEIQYDYLTPLTNPRIVSQLYFHQFELSQIEEALIRFLQDPNAAVSL